MNYNMNSYELEIASGLGMVACVYFPSKYWAPSCFDTCRPCSCCLNLCEFIGVLLCLEGLFPWYPPSFLSLTVFLPQRFLSPEGRDSMETTHWELSAAMSHTLCILSCYASLCLYPDTAGESFSVNG